MRATRLVLVMVAVCAVPAAFCYQLVIKPTTTLSLETGNNTSTAHTFVGTTNGNLGAGNVSKIPVRSLLYPGSTTQIYAHVVPWWGKDNHMDVGYSSQDSDQVRRQVEDMASRGLDGAIVDWYGPTSYEDLGSKRFMWEAEAKGGFGLIIEIEHGAVKWNSCYPQCDVTTAVIGLIQQVAQVFFSSPNYVRQLGRPILMEFGMETLPEPVDWTKVQAAVPEVVWIHRNPGGFSLSQSRGSFAWLEPQPLDKLTPDYDSSAYLQYFYKIAANYSDLLSYGSVFKGFDDTLASWSPPGGRHIHQNCGQTWLKTFSVLNQWYSAANPLHAMQLTTWNDYEEGSALESGIDNCVKVSGAVANGVLTWDVTGQENTVDHYVVFLSEDGENLMSLGEFSAGTRGLNLATFGVSAGDYTVYVKAIGKPLIRNQMSPGIAYKVPNRPPTAALALSSLSVIAPGTVTASTAGSADSDGKIASSKIDFGNGTILSGPTAVYTYPTAGTFPVTATVTDNLGATASTTSFLSVAAPGVFISAPANGATLGSPMRVAVNTVSAKNISAMCVYVDDVLVHTAYARSLDIYLAIKPGTHRLLTKSWDSTGAIMRAEVSVTVSNRPPTAAISLSLASGIGPLQVTASTAASRDPDGTIASSRIDFGDGATVAGPSAVHTYKSAGTYKVIGTVLDDFGAAASANSTVSVLPGVIILGPSPGTTVSTMARVRATAIASAGRRIASMIIYVDDVAMYTVFGNSVDTYLKLRPGSRRILVKSWEDTTGVIYSSETIVTAK